MARTKGFYVGTPNAESLLRELVILMAQIVDQGMVRHQTAVNEIVMLSLLFFAMFVGIGYARYSAHGTGRPTQKDEYRRIRVCFANLDKYDSSSLASHD